MQHCIKFGILSLGNIKSHVRSRCETILKRSKLKTRLSHLIPPIVICMKWLCNLLWYLSKSTSNVKEKKKPVSTGIIIWFICLIHAGEGQKDMHCF